MEQIEVGGFTVDVVRKDIKNLHLGVYPPSGRVRIAVPLGVDDERVRLFAISRLGWIKRVQRGFEGQARVGAREYVTGESHYFAGRRYRLNVVEQDGPPEVVLRHQHLDLLVRPAMDADSRRRVMDAWYRAALKKKVQTMLPRWMEKLGVPDIQFGIRQMKTKWGSCNIGARRIWLNLELAKRADEVIEMVVVHELMHFFERHHNERFFALMSRHLPEWRRIKAELKDTPLPD